MSVSIRPSTATDTLRQLHAECLPDDVHEDYSEGHWWVATEGGKAVGFAGVRPSRSWPQAAYLSRAGVLPSHRGQGLQRRLIRVRVALAKRQGFTHCITTTFENPASANNLIREGFLTYLPATPWGAEGTIYWIKRLC